MDLQTILANPSGVARFLRRELSTYVLAAQSLYDYSLVSRSNVEWLFILTFPNGGSTALAQLLLTARNTTALTPNAEGLWLLPSLYRFTSRWDPNVRVWQRRLRAVWLNRIPKQNQEPLLVIEKSPANMSRYETLLSTFSTMRNHLVTLTRDPYATCASWHQRYGPTTILRHLMPITDRRLEDENDYFTLLGELWLERAAILFKAREHSVIDIRYEDFADDTENIIAKIGKKIPQLREVSSSAPISVKDYKKQPVTNMNERQIATLTRDQKKSISKALSRKSALVESLGYAIV